MSDVCMYRVRYTVLSVVVWARRARACRLVLAVVPPRARDMAGGLRNFYDEYHGHRVQDLETLADTLPCGRGTIYLVGDSTLDNKYWLGSESEAACNGYERCLAPPRSTPDVAYWINRECEQRGLGHALCCVNAAIEESTLGLRDGDTLLPQDAFVQRRLCEKDVIVVSMGGNDIALRPTIMTVICMLTLLSTPTWVLEAGIAPGISHFVGLFRNGTRRYLRNLIKEQQPRCVVCCMLYYLDERPGGSWADFTLQKLGCALAAILHAWACAARAFRPCPTPYTGPCHVPRRYNTEPKKLQYIMREVYRRGTSRIELGGVPVIPVPLYEALDGKDTRDYVQRVEPSSAGGRKLARLIMDRLQRALGGEGAVETSAGGKSPADAGTSSCRNASSHDQAPQQVVAKMPSPVHLGV